MSELLNLTGYELAEMLGCEDLYLKSKQKLQMEKIEEEINENVKRELDIIE